MNEPNSVGRSVEREAANVGIPDIDCNLAKVRVEDRMAVVALHVIG